MVVDIKPEKKYTHGGTFVKYSADGGSFAYYPSGRMAAAMERMGGGFYCYFYADTAKGLTLSAFDPIGVGYCCFPDGSPRLTSAKNGGTYKASQDDNQLRMWSTSKPLSSPISFDLSPNIHIEFGSRQAITAKLTCAGVTEEYQLGDVPKMSGESYLDKVVSQIRMGPERGKYVLDIDKCRQAAVLNRERREAMGMSEIPVTQVHITEDTMQKHVDLRPIVASTDALHKSVGAGDWSVDSFIDSAKMATVLGDAFPTLRMPEEDLRGDPHSRTLSSLAATQKDKLSLLLTDADVDNGALPLSKAIMGASGRYRPEHGQHYKTPRKRLKPIKQATFDEQLTDAPKDQLQVVCVMSGNMPQCRRALAWLETLNGDMARAAAGSEKAAPPPGMEALYAASADSKPFPNFALLEFNAQEGRLMQQRYNCNTFPMYLMFLGGKLAYANNVLNGFGTSRADLLAQVETTIAAAKNGQFKPADFKFGASSDGMTADFGATIGKK